MENVLKKLAFSLFLMYCNKAAKKNMPYKTSLRSVTQATDSTLIGCKANKAVANAAPIQPSRNLRDMKKTSMTQIKCKMRLVWCQLPGLSSPL